jgi:hypothetical protein
VEKDVHDPARTRTERIALGDALYFYLNEDTRRQQDGERYLKQFPDVYKEAQAARNAKTDLLQAEKSISGIGSELGQAMMQRMEVRSTYAEDLAHSGKKYEQRSIEVKNEAEFATSRAFHSPGITCKQLGADNWQIDWNKLPKP